MEFITHIETALPEDMDEDLSKLLEEESDRTKQLHARGHLVRLWRPVGEKTSLGLWRAIDADELHREALDTLPLRQWMKIQVIPVESHPNDPRAPKQLR